MKKLISTLLALAMAFGLASCGTSSSSGAPSGSSGSGPQGDAAAPYKIAIITGTVSQGEEEFRAAQEMKEKYPDIVVTATYPDNFSKEQETTISNVLNLVADPEVKALVFLQAVPGAAAAISKAKELRPDLLVIAGVTGEDPAIIAREADMVLNADELGMGRTIMEQAKAMGAKTFVHYSFPRHMSVALLAGRRDLLRQTAEELGIEFVEATAPDPTGDSGVPGAQQFILEDVPKMIAKYGKDTAFFATNCSMQEPLIKQVIAGGAIFPQQCCPSPYHGYPGALGIAIPEDKAGDVGYILSETTRKITEGKNAGRMSTWPVPINMLFVRAGVQYAMDYLDGKIESGSDMDAMAEICAELSEGTSLRKLTENGKEYDNFFTLLSPYYTYGGAADAAGEEASASEAASEI